MNPYLFNGQTNASPLPISVDQHSGTVVLLGRGQWYVPMLGFSTDHHCSVTVWPQLAMQVLTGG